MLLCRSGLFRPLRSPAYERTLVCSVVSSETEDQEEKYLVVIPLVMKTVSAWFLVPGEGESQERAEAGEGDDEEGAADPVSEKRRQEEKGKVAT